MNEKKQIITLIIACCILLNGFAFRVQALDNGQSSFEKALSCQSVLLYCTSMSMLTMRLVNTIFAKDIGLPVPVEERAAQKTDEKTRKNTSSDYCVLNAQANGAGSAGVSQQSNPSNPLYSYTSLDSEINAGLNSGNNLWVHIFCLFMLMMFFLMPRGSIDDYAISIYICRT